MRVRAERLLTNFFDEKRDETVVDEHSIAGFDHANDVLVVDVQEIFGAFVSHGIIDRQSDRRAILQVDFTVHSLKRCFD